MDREDILARARRMADWIADNLGADPKWEMLLGTVLHCSERDPKRHFPAPQWNQAFVMMSMLSAHRVFGDDKYRRAAAAIARQLRSLQIFDPFLPDSYGAIREQSAMTDRCYVRDALSGAWGYLEYYRASGGSGRNGMYAANFFFEKQGGAAGRGGVDGRRERPLRITAPACRPAPAYACWRRRSGLRSSRASTDFFKSMSGYELEKLEKMVL